MGLGAPRKRAKISHDPNNTAWSRSSTKYGRKILESQGWLPGDCLGAKDAEHATLHYAATASHIRVALKDDNLGLGAKRGVNDEDRKTTGLNMFQDLLGRLNGKTEQEVHKGKMVRANMRRSVFVEQRWGKLRFVHGGFLLGEELQLPKEQLSVNSMAEGILQDPEKGTMYGLKTDHEDSPKEHKKRNRERARRVRDESNKQVLVLPQAAIETFSAPQFSLKVDCTAQDMDRVKRREDKAEQKLKRQDRKEARKEKSPSSMALPLPNPVHLQPQLPAGQVPVEHADGKARVLTKAHVAIVGGRNAVRRRYIQHKKMAMMDSKALNEILRIRT